MTKARIQKVLSEAGLASRRAIEEMVGEGRIRVNGTLVSQLPCFVDPGVDKVCVDGETIKLTGETKCYVLLNKPRNVVCTSRDPGGRKRAVDCIGPVAARLYCVGRLDADSTGLILLTNDGELTQHLTHPSHEVTKIYRVQIDGALTVASMDRLKKGVWLDGKRTGGAALRVISRHPTASVLEVGLKEGRNREIRRILARLGHKVRRLHRVAIGPITDKGLGIGSWRDLSAKEVQQLRRSGAVDGDAPPTRGIRRGPARSKGARRGGARRGNDGQHDHRGAGRRR